MDSLKAVFCRSIPGSLEIGSENFTQIAGANGPPGRYAYRAGEQLDRSIHHANIDPARVVAARRDHDADGGKHASATVGKPRVPITRGRVKPVDPGRTNI